MPGVFIPRTPHPFDLARSGAQLETTARQLDLAERAQNRADNQQAFAQQTTTRQLDAAERIDARDFEAAQSRFSAESAIARQRESRLKRSEDFAQQTDAARLRLAEAGQMFSQAATLRQLALDDADADMRREVFVAEREQRAQAQQARSGINALLLQEAASAIPEGSDLSDRLSALAPVTDPAQFAALLEGVTSFQPDGTDRVQRAYANGLRSDFEASIETIQAEIDAITKANAALMINSANPETAALYGEQIKEQQAQYKDMIAGLVRRRQRLGRRQTLMRHGDDPAETTEEMDRVMGRVGEPNSYAGQVGQLVIETIAEEQGIRPEMVDITGPEFLVRFAVETRALGWSDFSLDDIAALKAQISPVAAQPQPAAQPAPQRSRQSRTNQDNANYRFP